MNTIVGQQDVCPGCAGDIDPENHVTHASKRIDYCSIECYIQEEL